MTAQVTLAECEAALSHVIDAPKDGAIINELCLRPDVGARAFPDSLELTVENGIIGDRWKTSPWLRLPDGSPDPKIQVSVLSKRVMDLCWRDQKNKGRHPGDPLVVDMDLGMENLPVGTRLNVGSAVIEVSVQFNTGCVKWRNNYGAESVRWINRRANRPYRLRGILCSIVQDGVVRVGDRLLKS